MVFRMLQQHGSNYFAHRPPTLGVKIQLFQNMFLLHIKFKGIKNAATWKQIFCLHPHPPFDPWRMSKGQNSTFLEHGYIAYQNKGYHECNNVVANILPTSTPNPRPLGMSKGHNSTFSEHVHVAYQIKGNHKCSNMVANIFSNKQRQPPGTEVVSKGQN